MMSYLCKSLFLFRGVQPEMICWIHLAFKKVCCFFQHVVYFLILLRKSLQFFMMVVVRIYSEKAVSLSLKIWA